jgi:hypothetical protein
MGSPIADMLVTVLVVGGGLGTGAALVRALAAAIGPAGGIPAARPHPAVGPVHVPGTRPPRRPAPIADEAPDPARTRPDAPRLNVTEADGHRWLRVTLRHGQLVHLAPPAADGTAGRPATAASRVAGSGPVGDSLLTRPVWTARTLCGMPWVRMADDAAEVEALTASVTRDCLRDVTVCPVCAGAVPRP